VSSREDTYRVTASLIRVGEAVLGGCASSREDTYTATAGLVCVGEAVLSSTLVAEIREKMGREIGLVTHKDVSGQLGRF
jgi:NADH pyrophosphatase NudC (nudix superfamily)